MRKPFDKQPHIYLNVQQLMAQQDAAARLWARLFPGKPAHFEVEGDAMTFSDKLNSLTRGGYDVT